MRQAPHTGPSEGGLMSKRPTRARRAPSIGAAWWRWHSWQPLERYDLRYASTDKPFANAFPGAGALKVYQDPERTLAGLREHGPGDAAGWTELKGLFDRLSPTIFDLYGSTMPSAGAALAAGRAL